MELNGPTTRIPHRRPTRAVERDRFLCGYPQSATQPTEENELSEDDIFSTGNPSTSTSSSASASASSTPRHHPQKPPFPFPEPSGILAVLPQHNPPNPQPHTHLYQKSNLSSSSSSSCSSSSSTRLIPTRVLSFPKINHPHHPQSAPVNVPVQMRPGGGGRRNNDRELDETEEEELGDGEMLPPHVIVALSHTPAMACSVLEGAGRTLKGRDLRQVRNAVWRRTGFLD